MTPVSAAPEPAVAEVAYDGDSPALPRLLVFVVAYDAERTISDVLSRIPDSLAMEYDVEILVIDDASRDRTFERGD